MAKGLKTEVLPKIKDIVVESPYSMRDGVQAYELSRHHGKVVLAKNKALRSGKQALCCWTLEIA
jgi:hypothetical protein